MAQQNPLKRTKYEQSDELQRSSPRGFDPALDRRGSPREFDVPPPRGHYDDRGALQRMPTHPIQSSYDSNMPPPSRAYDDRGGYTRGGPSFYRDGPPRDPHDDRGAFPTTHGLYKPVPLGHYDNRGPQSRDTPPPPIPPQRSASDPYNRSRSKNYDDSDRNTSALREYRYNNQDPPFRHPFLARPPLDNLVVPHRKEGWREEWKAKANTGSQQQTSQDPYFNSSVQRDRTTNKKYFAFRRMHNSPVNNSPSSNAPSNSVNTPSNSVSKNETSKPRHDIRDHEIINLTNTIDTIMDYKMVLALLPLNIMLDNPVLPGGNNNSNTEELSLLNPAIMRQDSKSISTPRQVISTPNINNNTGDKFRGTPIGTMSARTPDNASLSGQRTSSSAPQSQGYYRQNSSNNPQWNGSNYR